VNGEVRRFQDKDVFLLTISGGKQVNRVIRLRLEHKSSSDLRIVVFKNGECIKIVDDFCLPTGARRGRIRPARKSVREEMANLAQYPGNYYFVVRAAAGGKGRFPAKYTLSLLNESRSEFTEIEPNDSLGNATPVEAAVSIEGYLSPMGNLAAGGRRERDYYKLRVTATNKTVIDIKVTGVPGTDIVLSLLDSRGTLIRRSDSSGMHMGESINKLGIRKGGDYYILLHPKKVFSGSHSAPYTLRVDVESYQKGQEMEPNDSIREANPVDAGEKVSGFFNQSNDEDVYSFKIPHPGRYILSARLKDVADVDSFIQVFDRKGNQLISINLSGAGEPEYIANLPLLSTAYDQIFYILVGSRKGKNSDDPYELYIGIHEASFMGEFGDNNSRLTANMLNLNSEKKGFLYPQGDRDWYSFRISENQHLRISLSGVNGVDFTLGLFDTSGKELRSVNGSGMSEGESIMTDLVGPAVYYLRVAGLEGFHANAREAYTLIARSSAPGTLPAGQTLPLAAVTNSSGSGTIASNTSSSESRTTGSRSNNGGSH